MSLKKIVIGCVALIVAIMVCASSCSVVGPTERGIMVTMGKPSDKVLMPGMHFKAPFAQSIKRYDMSPIEYEKSFSVGDDGALSKDQQTVGLTFTLYWQYDENRLYEVATGYSNKDKIYQPVSSAIKAAIKDEVGKWSVEEIVSKQSVVQENVRSAFTSNPDVQRIPVKVTGFVIGNWDWSESYDNMIQATMARKQEVERTKQEVLLTEQNAMKALKEAEVEKQKAEQEAQAKIARANGDAEAKIAKAKADAEATKLEADAIAYKNAKIAQNYQIEVKMKELDIQYERAKHWNGKEVPDAAYVVPGTGAVVPLTK